MSKMRIIYIIEWQEWFYATKKKGDKNGHIYNLHNLRER